LVFFVRQQRTDANDLGASNHTGASHNRANVSPCFGS
jgi:hypothetical protein